MDLQKNQRSFDLVSVKLVEQGHPSFIRVLGRFKGDFEIVCQYRGPNGDRCGAGHLFDEIPEGAKIEGFNAFGGIVGQLIEASGHSQKFARELQIVHDTAAKENLDDWLEDWSMRMRHLAIEYGLSFDVLEDALEKRAQALQTTQVEQP